MTTITVKLPESLNRALTARARKQNRAKSDLVREALEGMLSDTDGRGRTVGEVAGHLAGCVKGPRDLSYNEKYMEDFGL